MLLWGKREQKIKGAYWPKSSTRYWTQAGHTRVSSLTRCAILSDGVLTSRKLSSVPEKWKKLGEKSAWSNYQWLNSLNQLLQPSMMHRYERKIIFLKKHLPPLGFEPWSSAKHTQQLNTLSYSVCWEVRGYKYTSIYHYKLSTPNKWVEKCLVLVPKLLFHLFVRVCVRAYVHASVCVSGETLEALKVPCQSALKTA